MEKLYKVLSSFKIYFTNGYPTSSTRSNVSLQDTAYSLGRPTAEKLYEVLSFSKTYFVNSCHDLVEYGRRTIRDIRNLHHWLSVLDKNEGEKQARKDQASPVLSREELAVSEGIRLKELPFFTPMLETLVRYRPRLPSLSNSLYSIGVRGWWPSLTEWYLKLVLKFSLLLNVLLFSAFGLGIGIRQFSKILMCMAIIYIYFRYLAPIL